MFYNRVCSRNCREEARPTYTNKIVNRPVRPYRRDRKGANPYKRELKRACVCGGESDRKGREGPSRLVYTFACSPQTFNVGGTRCDVGVGLAPTHGFTPSRPLRSLSPPHTSSL